jgi:RNA polymerase sigma factor (sigma-70 family)
LTESPFELKIFSFSASLENALPDGGDSPEAAAQATQRRQLVAEALETLTTGQRAIVLMRHRDRQTWRAIAAALNVTPAAACRTGQRAIARLQRWFAARDLKSGSL